MNSTLSAFYLVIIGCAFGLSIFVSRFVGNLLVLGTFVLFLVTAVETTVSIQTLRERRWSDLPIRADPMILYPTLVLWAVFVIDLALYPSTRALLRTGAFIITSGTILFVVPAVVSRERAFTAIGVIGAAFVVFSLPAALLGTPFRIGGIVLSGVAGAPIEIFGLVFHSPTSIFDSQNYFRGLVALGTVASAGVFGYTRNPRMAIICVIDLIGVYLTLGRAARLATVVAASLAVVYLVAGRRGLAGVTVAGTLATVVIFAGAIGLLPSVGPAEMLRSALNHRLEFWNATFETIKARPVLGWGLVDNQAAIGDRYAGHFSGVHNSYFRLFLVGGIIGGVAYLALCAAALITSFSRIREQMPLSMTTFCLVVMVLIFQLFAGGTIFGTSLSSVLWAVAIGYAQPIDVEHISTDRLMTHPNSNRQDST